MLQLRRLISLCLSISLIFGEIIISNPSYASFADSDPNYNARRRHSPADEAVRDSDIDVEKAEQKLLKEKFLKENKEKFHAFIGYGMASIALLVSYKMLSDMSYMPQTLSSSKMYNVDDLTTILNQRHSFTNSNAFNTLQYSILFIAVGTMMMSVSKLWQVRDKLPSSKVLKRKGKDFSIDAGMTLLYGASSVLLKTVPKSYNVLHNLTRTNQELPVFRPVQGTTKVESFSEGWDLREDIYHLLRIREIPLIRRLVRLKPASEEFIIYEKNPPKELKARHLIFDGSDLHFCPVDLAFLLNLRAFCEIRLRRSNLKDQQFNLIKYFSSSLERLDISENPNISMDSLLDSVVWAIAPQHTRGIVGFDKIRSIVFDAREDLICDKGLLIGLKLPTRRKLRVSGELTRKDELRKLFDRHFHYFNQDTPNSSLPEDLVKILGRNPKRNLQNSYVEKGYRDGPEINYERLSQSFNTIREVINYILGVGSKDAFYLIEYDDNNKPVLYRSPAQQLKSIEETSTASSSETKIISSKTKDYRLTSDRIFGKLRKNSKTLEEGIQYLEKDILSAKSRGAYLIEYDSAGNPIFYGAHSIFQYHDQNDVWFTPSTIYLPNIFKDRYDSRLYLREKHKIYKASDPDKLMAGEVSAITSFIKVDLKEGFIVLADELKHCDKQHMTVRKLEELGLLTEVRLVETLTECGFLKSLQLEVVDNSWY